MNLNLELDPAWLQRFTGELAPLVQEGELAQWIVYEDDHILALNKPGWLVCHPSKQGPMSSLVGAAKQHLGTDKGHLVSRLDRETSGIVLIAKTRHGASQYQKAIEQRRVTKHYWVWVHGKLSGQHEVNQPLAKDLESAVYVKQTVRKSNSSQSAVTQFEGLHYHEAMDVSVVKATPITGRKHQIRAHALWLGHPVVGDKVYGPDDQLYLEFIEHGWTANLQEQLGFPRQALHAAALEFEGLALQSRFAAPLPPDLAALSAAIGWSPPFNLESRPVDRQDEPFSSPASMSQVRVRFAPSPTGFFHIGSARTALFNWLYARKTGGTFVLRIEDTDKERNTEEALRVLLDGMRWLGLDWDEGPEKGGDYGPYFQSERREIYDRYLQRLRDNGRAYDKDGAVYFKVSGEPQVIQDEVRGRVQRLEEQDFVIIRSDGNPVFHFVNVVDDIAMKITHVIRGEDHLSNTSKHTELFRALGEPVPVFAHIPLILKQAGPGKMSKRDKGALIEEYQQKHFLPSAVRNYLCLLGWNPKDNREVMAIETILEEFSFGGIQKGSAKFDEKKMAFINTETLRGLEIGTFSWMASQILADAGVLKEDVDESYLQRVMQLVQPKVNGLDTLADYVGYFFNETFSVDAKVSERLEKKGGLRTLLEQLVATLQPVQNWTDSELEHVFQTLAATHGHDKPFAWFPALRWAVSGVGGGPDLIPLLGVLGKERVMTRLNLALEQAN